MAGRKTGVSVKVTHDDAVEFVRQQGLDPEFGIGRQILEFWESVETSDKADRRRKGPGRAKNQYAGYGYVWRGQRGKRKRVKHEREQQVIAWIVKYRGEGYSWNELHSHLAENAVLTAKGKPWSVMRIRRAYRAVMKAGGSLMEPNPENMPLTGKTARPQDGPPGQASCSKASGEA